MNALEALALARETGCKVRPKSWTKRYIECIPNSMAFLIKHETRGLISGCMRLAATELINTNKGFVEWIVVPEPHS